MSRYGKYDPGNTGHNSSLFSYGEAPLASQKLNLWNGNLAASIEWLNQCMSVLAVGMNDAVILSEETSLELAVTEQPSPGLTVRVRPGKAIIAETFVGLDEEVTLPETGTFIPPVIEPRYDLIYLDAYTNFTILQGQEGEPSGFLTAPAGALPLAEVYLRPGIVSIKNTNDGFNGYITDARPVRIIGNAHLHSLDRSPGETPDGVRKQFSTSRRFQPDSLDVFVNGILQVRGESYTVDSNEQGYTFWQAPPAGYQIQHRYLAKG
jgi:hypothetical protein